MTQSNSLATASASSWALVSAPPDLPQPFGPVWLDAAWIELGQRERDGLPANDRIAQFYRDAGHPNIRGDNVAWCAAFVGAMLKRSGHRPTGSLMARSYLTWGEPLVTPRFGAVAVFSRGADASAGHVGFLLGTTGEHCVVLGGNQSDAVTVELVSSSRLLGYRWPSPDSNLATASPSRPFGQSPVRTGAALSEVFEVALSHVLAMEGGFTDDPDDPGGPTNRGLTFDDLKRHRGATFSKLPRDRQISELLAIPDADVRAIYANDYWQPSGCPTIPPWLAIFHFDTAVNMGNGTAIRMLQTALGVVIDGEIGPETSGAVAIAQPRALLQAYAELRRRRYRSLQTFSRFGRGWLNRTQRTLDRALALAASTATKDPSMTTEPNAAELNLPKWWGNSTTIWGALITGLAAVLPAIAPAVGLEIPKDAVTDSAEQIGAIVQAATGLAGTLLAIFGRVRATRPLVRRELKVLI